MKQQNMIKRNEPGYLQNYEGTYRVKAEFDKSTNDFPRDCSGQIHPEFDDYYIPCKDEIQIKYGYDDIMSCFIPTLRKGIAILKTMYGDKIGPYCGQSLEAVTAALLSEKVLIDLDVLDFEVYFTFKESQLAYVAKLVKASSYGAKIHALSPKNLPQKPPYTAGFQPRKSSKKTSGNVSEKIRLNNHLSS